MTKNKKKSSKLSKKTYGGYNQALNDYEKMQMYGNMSSGATTSIGSAINPVVGGIMGLGQGIGNNLRQNNFEKVDKFGNVNEKKVIQGAVIGSFFDPIKALSTRLSYKGGLTDFSGKGYAKIVADKAKAEYDRKQYELAKPNIMADLQTAANFPVYGVNQSYFAKGGKIGNPGEPVKDNTNIVNPIQVDYMNDMINNYGKPLKKRYDFKANLLTRLVLNNSPKLPHGDWARYYGGYPLEGKSDIIGLGYKKTGETTYDLRYSKYKPSKSKDKNAVYISNQDSTFKSQILKYYNENYEGKPLHPRYNSNPKVKNDFESFSTFRDLGNFTIDKGSDEKGDYISYYDVWNYSRNDNPDASKTEFLGAVKPYEVYDRIYLNDFEKENKKALGGYPSPQYEAEDKEVIQHAPMQFPQVFNGGGINPLSSTTSEIVGNSHNEGGVEMAGGEKIYSDKLKPKGMKKTYADIAKLLGNKKGKYEKLNDDAISQNTKRIGTALIDKQLDDLFNQQEMTKMQKVSRNSKGLPKAYEGLDIYDLLYNKNNPNYFSNAPIYGGMPNKMPVKQYGYSANDIKSPTLKNSPVNLAAPLNGEVPRTKAGQFISNPNVQTGIGQGLGMLGDYINQMAYINKMNQPNKVALAPRVTLDKNMDTAAYKRAAIRALRTGQKQAGMTGNSNVANAVRGDMLGKYFDAMGNVNTEANNYRMQTGNQEAGINAQIAAQNTQILNDLYAAQNQFANNKLAAKQRALSGLFGNAQLMIKDYRQQSFDKEKINLLNKGYNPQSVAWTNKGLWD